MKDDLINGGTIVVKETSARNQRRTEKSRFNLNLVRKVSIAGLLLGIAFIILGQRSPTPELGPTLFVLGYTVFLISTGVVSFITVFKMLYPRSHEKREVKVEKPKSNFCPRCKANVERGRKFCSNCGKQMSTKARS